MNDLQHELTRCLLLSGARIVYEWEKTTRWYRCTFILGECTGTGAGQSTWGALMTALMSWRENAEKQLTPRQS